MRASFISDLQPPKPVQPCVLFIDRQTSVAVDLSEHLAVKTAIQDAATKLTERMLPKLVGR